MSMTAGRLGRYKAKTLLMSLGIIISVVATVLMQTLGGGFLEAITRFTQRVYPTDSVLLYSVGDEKLDLQDVETVVASTPEVSAWDVYVSAGERDIKRDGSNVRVSVSGFSERADRVARRTVSEGEFFTATDIRNRARVVLIGEDTAKQLFPHESAIGGQLFIDNVPFEVRGVLEPFGVDPHGNNLDQLVVMPYTTLMDQILRSSYITAARFTVADPSRVEKVGERVAQLIRDAHGVRPGQQSNYFAVTPSATQMQVGRAFQIYNIFLPLIAGITFFISGKVILSIMLITSRERRPELGLRKALGARPSDLQLQIVLEVAVVAIIAALVGLIIARVTVMALAPVMAEKFGMFGLAPPVGALALGFALAVVTGVAAAWLPARNAARLDPIQALR
jgi:putative ABC transport system permease protein